MKVPADVRSRAGAGHAGATRGLAEVRGNADCDWDRFDPEWYVDHNYRVLGEDDRRIIQIVRDFFSAALGDTLVPRGIDVGAGANIYPALTMLPFCEEITLWERGRHNVKWLQRELGDFSETWDDYWGILTTRRAYREIERPRETLRERARAWHGDVFRLSPGKFQLGTMFFVAESISEKRNEFQAATRRFIGSLTAGAPFAAAFMENSSGYDVDSLRFPAVAVRRADVKHLLSSLVHDLRIYPIDRLGQRREGYDGMILALGKAGPTGS